MKVLVTGADGFIGSHLTELLFLRETNLKGVTTLPIWTLMNELIMFQHCQSGDLPNTEWLEQRVVSMPSSMVII